MAARPTRSTARLAAILDRLPDALLLVDSTGLVENANARALATFGAAGSRALVGLPLAGLLPGLDEVLEASPEPELGPEPRPHRVVARALDGTVFGVEAICSTVPWGGGEERMLVCLRRGFDAELQPEPLRTDRAAMAVLRAAEEAVCGVDRDGRVVLANPAAGRMFGFRVSTIAGQDLHALVLHTRADGSPYPAAESPIARTLRTGRRIQQRAEVVWRRDGTPVPVELNTAAIKAGPEIVGAVLAFTDLTEHEELDRRRSRLIELLADALVPGLAEELAEHPSERLAALHGVATEALDYENLMGGQAAEALPTELSGLIDEAVSAIRASAADRGVRIEVSPAGATVPAVRNRLRAALVELLRTAVEASDRPGIVTVRTTVSPEHTRIEVGGAISTVASRDPLLLRLRGSATGSRGPDLAYVQLVAETHGGRLLLEPASEGTRSFVLELPAVSAGDLAPGLGGGPMAAVGVGPTEAAVAESTTDTGGNVIPLPARRQPAAPGPVVPAPAAPADPPAPPRVYPQILVWPRATASLADALGARGLGSVALDRGDRPAVVPAGTAVVLVDPGPEPLSRRMLGELGKAAAGAALPMLFATRLIESGTEPGGIDPADLVNALLDKEPEAASVLLIEEDQILARALGGRLAEAGFATVHARSDARAAARVLESRPDLVLRNLSVPAERVAVPAGWSQGPELSGPIPIILYSAHDLTSAELSLLAAGQALPALAPRSGTHAADALLADLLAALAL